MSDDAPLRTDGGDEEEEPVADPFAELGGGVDDSEGGERERLDANADDDPFSDDAHEDSGGLFSDDADSTADLDDAFEQMDVSGPAAEDVWESLDADMSDAGAAVDTGGTREIPTPPGAADPGEVGVEHVVNKRTYCQQCPHFSAPPDVACGHDGTTIVEVIGFDEFRVRNCPMVSEEDPSFDTDS